MCSIAPCVIKSWVLIDYRQPYPKVHLVKAMVFPVVIYGCESWTINKTESQRVDTLQLWCWRRLLRVPWTAGTSNQSILKEINPEYSLEGLMLKLKLQCFGHLMWRLIGKDWCWEGLKAGREGGDRGWDSSWKVSLTWWTWVWANSGRCWRTGKPGVLWQTNPQFTRLAHESESRSGMSDSLQPHGLYSPWNSPDQDWIALFLFTHSSVRQTFEMGLAGQFSC